MYKRQVERRSICENHSGTMPDHGCGKSADPAQKTGIVSAEILKKRSEKETEKETGSPSEFPVPDQVPASDYFPEYPDLFYAASGNYVRKYSALFRNGNGTASVSL